MEPGREGGGGRSGTGCGSETEGGGSWAAPAPDQAAALRVYKQGIWTLQELLILQAVRREDIVRRKEGFERQLKEGLAQKELKSRVERWQEIEEACWARGVHRSAEQCQSRWEYMSREWRRIDRHESSCTRAGEPSYWALAGGERTHRGLVSNFPYELYQALLEWVGKLTRNVHFHQCPGTGDVAPSPGCTESSTSDVHGVYGGCQGMDGNVGSGAMSSARQSSSGEHFGGGQGLPPPGVQGAGPCHFPHLGPFPPPYVPGGMFPPLPYLPMPWPHPSYPMHPGYFQQPVMPPCARMAGQVPGAGSSSCAAGFVSGDFSSPCGHSDVGGRRDGTACPSSAFRQCVCAPCGIGQSDSGHAAAWGIGCCQHLVKGLNSAAGCPSVVAPNKPGHPASQTEQKSPDAGDSARATQFPQGPGDVMQSCHPGCKVGPSGAGFSSQQCSAYSSSGFFPTNFVRPPPPFFYGSPVYLPYPCPRCNMSPWAFSYQSGPHSGHSGCPAQAPAPPSWHKPEEMSSDKLGQVLYPRRVQSSAEGADITDAVLCDGGATPFQEPQDTDGDTNDVEEAQYEEEPRFVMTEEWAELFARSEARRREKKRQQKIEAKAARKFARGGSSSSQEVDRPHLPDSEVNVGSIVSGDVSQAFVTTNHPDSQLYVDL